MAKVKFEEHDVSKIDYVAAMTDPAEMLKMGVGGAEAAKRAAILRASYDVSNGRVSLMTAGELPWSKLGVNVEEAVDSKEARELANIAWRAHKMPVLFAYDGKLVMSDETFIMVRQDTGAQLGTVGRAYMPIQNDDGFDCLDGVLKQYGAKYETAGAIFGGRRVWMQAQLPKLAFEAQPGDPHKTLLTFMLTHDGSGSDQVFATDDRAVCANTLRIAVRNATGKLMIRHVGNVKQRIEDAKMALEETIHGHAKFKESIGAMIKTEIDPIEYADLVLDAVLKVSAAQALEGAEALAARFDADQELHTKRFQRLIDKRQELLEDIVARHDGERCKPRGTVYGAFNAVTEAADHGGYKRFGSEDKRFESILYGEADALKQAAYTVAMQSI